MKRAIATGLAMGCLLVGVTEAKVYKWVDESGKVVFSQTPPPLNVKGEEVEVNAPPAASSPENEPASKDVDKVSEKYRGNPALDPKLRREYCEKGKKNLEVLERAGPNAEFLIKGGERIKLSPEEKEMKIKESRAVIKAYCD